VSGRRVRASDYLGGDVEWCVWEDCKHRAERGFSTLCPIHLEEVRAAERKALAEAHDRWLRERRTL